MAAAARRMTAIAASGAVVAWVWALAFVLFALRWASVDRPAPPEPPLLPYGELRVGVDASYPPFAVATADDLFGLDIDLARTLAHRLGVPVRFVNMGYDGLYDSLHVDQVDALITALRVDMMRIGAVQYTQPYFDAGMVLVSADPAVEGMHDMAGRRLAYEFGSSAEDVVRAWLRRIAPFTPRPYELPRYALDAARLGDADAALADAISARLYLREHPAWRAAAHRVDSAPIAIAVRGDRWRLHGALAAALREMQHDGTLDAILRRWL